MRAAFYKLSYKDYDFYIDGFDEAGGLLNIIPEQYDETSDAFLFQMQSVLHKKWMDENYRHKHLSAPDLTLSKEFTNEVSWLVQQFEGMTVEYIGPIIE